MGQRLRPLPRPRALSVLSSLSLAPRSVLGCAPLPALSLRAVGLPAGVPVSLRSFASVPRSPSARSLCPILPPQPPRTHAGCLSLGGSPRCRSSRRGVQSLRSFSPRGVSAFGGHASALADALRASLFPAHRSVVHCKPCGVFVVWGSLVVGGCASPSARLRVYFCKAEFTNV